jgi:hypothetical protein
MRLVYINTIVFLLLALNCNAQLLFKKSKSDVILNNYSSVELDSLNEKYYAFPHSEDINFSISDPFSFEVWFKTTVSGGTNPVFSKGDGAKIALYVMEANSANPHLNFSLGSASNYFNAKTNVEGSGEGSKIWNNFYYHIVCTYDGSESAAGIKIYINGELATIGDTVRVGTATLGNTDSLYINNSGDASITDRGQIGYSLFRVFNTELNASTVTTLFNGGIPLVDYESNVVLQHSVKNNLTSNSVNISTADVLNEKIFPGNTKKNRYKVSNNSVLIHGFGIWGHLAAFDQPNLYTSPVYGEWYSPFVWLDTASNKTYFSTQLRGHAWFNREAEFLYFDHTKSEVIHLDSRIKSISKDVTDVHQLLPIIKAPTGDFLTSREDKHNSPLYFAKTNGNVFDWTGIGTITGSNAYVNLFYSNDSLRAINRGGSDQSVQYVSASGDNGSTWLSRHKIIDLGTSNGNRAYPGVYYYSMDSVIYSFVFSRRESENWEAIYCIKSTDGAIWQDLGENISRNIYSNQHFSQTDLDTYCLVDELTVNSNNTLTMDCLDVVVDSSHTPHIVYVDTEQDSTYYATWNGANWASKAINIPTWIGDYRATAALIWKGDDNFDLFKIETRSGYDVIVKYETTNGFDTIDLGIIVSNNNRNYSQITRTHNYQVNDPVVILASEIQADGNETAWLWVYEYNPWD